MNFRVFQYIVILLVSFSCKEKESFDDVDIAVHAVSGLYNPQSFFVDNTKEAMDYALKFEELNGIEIDVQYSSDGTLWMFHDDLLDERTTANGRICEKSDEALNGINYTDINSTPISKLSTIDWSLNRGIKNIYLDLKNLNTCDEINYTPNQLISVLNELNQQSGLTFFPIIKDTFFASIVYDAGIEVYTDAISYEEASIQLSSFYRGVFIRNSDISSSEVSNLQINDKKVILYDMFSQKGVKSGLKKYPNVLLVEDFKSAIIERN